MPLEDSSEIMRRQMNIVVPELLPNPSHKELVAQLIEDRTKSGCEDAFTICNIGDIIEKYCNWNVKLPRIKPFYAVKCNDDPVVLKTLVSLGTGFDCASMTEISKILKLGVSSDSIIYANPCKQKSFIRYAAKNNVSLMTFDNETELYKIKELYPDAKLVIRILPPSDYKVQCELSLKFGCLLKTVPSLLKRAKDLDLKVVGVSFHVGSGCQEAAAYEVAIRDARHVFDVAEKFGYNFTLLDIGGGFPGHEIPEITFDEIAEVINESLDIYFPPSCGVDIIAEPGRYFVSSAYTLGVNIIAMRVTSRDENALGADREPDANDEPHFMYYVNDGVYGSFNCILLDHAKVFPSVIQVYSSWNKDKDLSDVDMLYSSSVWGPTCDGLDCILTDCQLPAMKVSDWLYFENMGAYTFCVSSQFNGMPEPIHYYYCDREIWNRFDWKEQNCDLKSRRFMEGTNFEDDLASLEISNI
uniref:ornithine decarboxylase n=1 Tax=Callistoctopus minor TaxID=515824 RepID=A0A2S1FRT9_CALMC|nr:ornithine decarboxylase [Callistoctopus minor]